MITKEGLIQLINDNIKDNVTGDISPEKMREVLFSMVGNAGVQIVDSSSTNSSTYSSAKIEALINTITSGMEWKPSVTTYSDIAVQYAFPGDGWTVNVKDTDITYRYDGQKWIAISANSIPNATAEVDGKMSMGDKLKLDGIATEATKNQPDSFLVSRANHTGTQAPSTIIQDASNRFVTDTEKSNWNGKASTAVATTSANGLMSSADKVKLNGIASNATANQTDAFLLNRANHTGAQPISSITGLQAELDSKISSIGSHTHTWADVTEKPLLFNPVAHYHEMTDILGLDAALDGKASATHNHDTASITSGILPVARGGTGLGTVTSGNFLRGNGTGAFTQRTPAQVLGDIGAAAASTVNSLVAEMPLKADKIHTHEWIDLVNVPNFALVNHSHTWADIGDKPLVFNPVAHYHEMTDILGLDAALSTKASSTHSHSAADITTGTLSVARGGTGLATVTSGNFLRGNGTGAFTQSTPAQVLSAIGAAAASHTHTWSQITGAPDFSLNGHTHTWAEISDKPLLFNPVAHYHEMTDVLGLDAALSTKADSSHTHSYSSLTGIPSSFTPAAHTHTEIVPLAAYGIGTATSTPRSFGTGFKHGFVRDTNGYPITYGKLMSFGSYTTSQDGGQFQILAPYSDVAGYNEGKPMWRIGLHDNRGWKNWETFASESWVNSNFVTPLQVAQGYANINHTHTVADIIDLDTSNFAPASHNHTTAQITSGTFTVARGGTGLSSVTTGNFLVGNGTSALVQKTPAQVKADLGVITASDLNWANISGKPLEFIPVAHYHEMTDILGLDAALSGKAAASHNHSAADITSGTLTVARGGTGLATITANNFIVGNGTSAMVQKTPAQVKTMLGLDTISVGWADVSGKPLEFIPVAHYHEIADINNLDTTLSGKANVTHTHSAADITSGTLSVARGGTGLATVTSGNFLRGNGTGAFTQSTPAQVLSAIGAAAASHTHAWADISTPPTTVAGYGITDAVTLSTAQTISGAKTFTGNVDLGNSSTRLTKGSNNSLRVTTNSGYVEIAPQNTGFCHINTDRDTFYFNKKIMIDGGVLQNYGGDGVIRLKNWNGDNVLTVDSSGNTTATGQVTAFSDARLKTNVKAYEGGLEKVMQLKPVTYDRTDIESDGEIGFIAQEVEKVESYLVKDGEYKSLDYSRMVVMLTQAVQEQQKLIEGLQEELEKLKGGK